MFTDLGTGSSHSSRKRPRACDDEGCELMPISKRINDLHIRSLVEPNVARVENGQYFPRMFPSAALNNNLTRDCLSNGENSQCHAQLPMLQKHSVGGGTYTHCQYAPELSELQNPYYYQVNQLLYQAHMQRIQRFTKCTV